MMFFSAKYRKDQERHKLLAELFLKARACGYYRMYHGDSEVRRLIRDDTSEFRRLLSDIRRLDPIQFPHAVATLFTSDSVVLLGLAVELCPELGDICAEKLMGFARENMKFCGHTDRAMWAKAELVLAREWYERAEELTRSRECEIEQGLTALAWIG